MQRQQQKQNFLLLLGLFSLLGLGQSCLAKKDYKVSEGSSTAPASVVPAPPNNPGNNGGEPMNSTQTGEESESNSYAVTDFPTTQPLLIKARDLAFQEHAPVWRLGSEATQTYLVLTAVETMPAQRAQAIATSQLITQLEGHMLLFRPENKLWRQWPMAVLQRQSGKLGLMKGTFLITYLKSEDILSILQDFPMLTLYDQDEQKKVATLYSASFSSPEALLERLRASSKIKDAQVSVVFE